MKPRCNSPPTTLCVLLFIVDTDITHFFFLFFGCLVLNEGCISLHQQQTLWQAGPPTPQPPSSEGSANVKTAGEQTTDHITSDLQSLHFLTLNSGTDLDAGRI